MLDVAEDVVASMAGTPTPPGSLLCASPLHTPPPRPSKQRKTLPSVSLPPLPAGQRTLADFMPVSHTTKQAQKAQRASRRVSSRAPVPARG
eukprot:10905569-Prorocentrum_lima.AAC.1